MKTCPKCQRRLESEAFTRNRAVCKACRAEAQRERRRRENQERLEEQAQAERERFREWQVRTLAAHEKNNETFQRMGWPERPPPDIEPGWFERMQARAQAAMRPRTGGGS